MLREVCGLKVPPEESNFVGNPPPKHAFLCELSDILCDFGKGKKAPIVALKVLQKKCGAYADIANLPTHDGDRIIDKARAKNLSALTKIIEQLGGVSFPTPLLTQEAQSIFFDLKCAADIADVESQIKNLKHMVYNDKIELEHMEDAIAALMLDCALREDLHLLDRVWETIDWISERREKDPFMLRLNNVYVTLKDRQVGYAEQKDHWNARNFRDVAEKVRVLYLAILTADHRNLERATKSSSFDDYPYGVTPSP